MPNSKGDGRGQVKNPENDGRLKENKGSGSSKGLDAVPPLEAAKSSRHFRPALRRRPVSFSRPDSPLVRRWSADAELLDGERQALLALPYANGRAEPTSAEALDP